MNEQTDLERLQHLLAARHSLVAISTLDEAHAIRLVRSAVSQSGHELWVWNVVDGMASGLFDDAKPVSDTEQPAGALFYASRRLGVPAVCVMLDVAGHLTDQHCLRLVRDAATRLGALGGTLVLIDHDSQLPPVIERSATRFEISLPDERELNDIVRDTVKDWRDRRNVQIKLSKRELDTIIRNLRGLSRAQARLVLSDAMASDLRLDAEDINRILAGKRRALQQDGVLQYIESPIDLSDIGGLRRLKRWLKQRRNSLEEDARAFGITPPRGVLMLGVQGAGKSLCAKAIASAWQQPLLRLDPGTLYDMYVGQSEKRLREALHQAESMSPIVLWIDEIEKGFASAASRSTDGGLSQRMFGTLLTWMQDHDAPVFLVATANDIEALPPELLRKGRFDEIFFVDLPRAPVRKIIASIHLKKRGRDPEKFDLDDIAEASDGYSGAEIEQAIVSALHEAYAEKSKVKTEHVVAALTASPPLSVTMRERIDALRAWAKDRCVPAD